MTEQAKPYYQALNGFRERSEADFANDDEEFSEATTAGIQVIADVYGKTFGQVLEQLRDDAIEQSIIDAKEEAEMAEIFRHIEAIEERGEG